MATSKKIRIEVHGKYSGHCAYYGNVLLYKDRQVDHLKPQRRKGNDDLENLCRPVEDATIISVH